jgi:hypothetical protein
MRGATADLTPAASGASCAPTTAPSSYIDHKGPGGVITHSWADYLSYRLTWLYGSAEARAAHNAPDLAVWNKLGDPK